MTNRPSSKPQDCSCTTAVKHALPCRFGFLKRWAVAMILVTALAMSEAVSRAEDGVSEGASSPDLTTLSLEELMAIEVESVSGASRYEQPVPEAPASVTLVTADEIKMFGYRTLADILRSVPGFSVINDRNYQYTGIRGLRIPGDYGTRMLLLVDGVRQNDTVYQTGYTSYEFAVDVDLIERVEIICGPGHTLCGANAMMGVINVITRRRILNFWQASTTFSMPDMQCPGAKSTSRKTSARTDFSGKSDVAFLTPVHGQG